jgi:hypothetical protein
VTGVQTCALPILESGPPLLDPNNIEIILFTPSYSSAKADKKRGGRKNPTTF